MKPARIAIVFAAMIFLAWLVRLMAHAKVPPPEGTWRELPLDVPAQR